MLLSFMVLFVDKSIPVGKEIRLVDMKRILHFCQNRSQLIQKGVQVTFLPIFPGQRNLMEVVEKKLKFVGGK